MHLLITVGIVVWINIWSCHIRPSYVKVLASTPAFSRYPDADLFITPFFREWDQNGTSLIKYLESNHYPWFGLVFNPKYYPISELFLNSGTFANYSPKFGLNSEPAHLLSFAEKYFRSFWFVHFCRVNVGKICDDDIRWRHEQMSRISGGWTE